MSEHLWEVNEHVIPASHIRGFARGVKDEGCGHLRLAVKQYVPHSNPNPQLGDVSIIMAHGVGSSKESYEPLFDELLGCNVTIRSVWAFDVAHHGASYVLNEDVIGDEPHWLDTSRDLLQMVNTFQTLMPPPIVGIGQSWGCVTILMASIMHPRLFRSIVAIEPTFETAFQGYLDRNHYAVLMAKRRDTWPSCEAARNQLKASAYYAAFDARVFDRVIKYDLRDVEPPLSSSNGAPTSVKLTTPKSMEVYTMMRPDPPLKGFPEAPDYAGREEDTRVIEGFYRGERTIVKNSLPYVLPSLLYVWAAKSPLSQPGYRSRIVDRTGIGNGGNGGVKKGQVKETLVNGCNHPIPLEQPNAAASAIAPWLNEELAKWREEANTKKEQPAFQSTIHEEWMAKISKL